MGGARHPQVGRHVHHPGRHPPHRPVPLGRAGRHRPPGVRAGVRPAGPDRPRRRDAGTDRRLGRRRRSTTSRPPASCWRPSGSGSRATPARPPPAGSSSTPGSWPTSWRCSSASWRPAPPWRRPTPPGWPALGVSSEADLAERIRAGEWSAEDRDLLDVVRPRSSTSSPWRTPSTSEPLAFGRADRHRGRDGGVSGRRAARRGCARFGAAMASWAPSTPRQPTRPRPRSRPSSFWGL